MRRNTYFISDCHLGANYITDHRAHDAQNQRRPRAGIQFTAASLRQKRKHNRHAGEGKTEDLNAKHNACNPYNHCNRCKAQVLIRCRRLSVSLIKIPVLTAVVIVHVCSTIIRFLGRKIKFYAIFSARPALYDYGISE